MNMQIPSRMIATKDSSDEIRMVGTAYIVRKKTEYDMMLHISGVFAWAPPARVFSGVMVKI